MKTTEIRATFQKRADGSGVVTVVKSVTDGGSVEESILLKGVASNEATAKSMAVLAADGGDVIWKVVVAD